MKACENCSKSKMRCTATNPYDESQCPQCKAKGLKCGLHRVQKPPGRKRGSKNSTTGTEDKTGKRKRDQKRDNVICGGGGGESDTEFNKSKIIKKDPKEKDVKQNVCLEYELKQRLEHLEYESEQRSEQRSNPSSVNPAHVVNNYYYGTTCNNNNSGRGEFTANSYNSSRPTDLKEMK